MTAPHGGPETRSLKMRQEDCDHVFSLDKHADGSLEAVCLKCTFVKPNWPAPTPTEGERCPNCRNPIDPDAPATSTGDEGDVEFVEGHADHCSAPDWRPTEGEVETETIDGLDREMIERLAVRGFCEFLLSFYDEDPEDVRRALDATLAGAPTTKEAQ